MVPCEWSTLWQLHFNRPLWQNICQKCICAMPDVVCVILEVHIIVPIVNREQNSIQKHSVHEAILLHEQISRLQFLTAAQTHFCQEQGIFSWFFVSSALTIAGSLRSVLIYHHESKLL